MEQMTLPTIATTLTTRQKDQTTCRTTTTTRATVWHRSTRMARLRGPGSSVQIILQERSNGEATTDSAARKRIPAGMGATYGKYWPSGKGLNAMMEPATLRKVV